LTHGGNEMKLTTTIGTIGFAFLLAGSSLLAAPTTRDIGQNKVIERAGVFPSQDGKCRATLTMSKMAGFLILTLDKQPNREVDDVNGMLWVSDGTLV
jgi:hypothetical protein